MTTTIFQSINERATSRFSHKIVLTHADLTETSANTAQTIALLTLPAFTLVRDVAIYLPTAFEDASDNALNTTTLIIGDSGDTARLLASTELNANGTEIFAKAGALDKTPYACPAATDVSAIFGSMAAKALSDIDAGEVHIFLDVVNLSAIS